MKRTIAVAVGLGLAVGVSAPTAFAAAKAAKAGAACTKEGEVSGTLTCTKDGRKKVWKASAAPTTVAKAAGGAATPVAAAGVKTGPGFDGKTITIGNITSKTNAAWGPISKGIAASLDSHFKSLNAKGGIAGKYQVKIEEVEVNYDPNLAVQGLNASKDKVAMYASVLGTPVNEALLPLYEQNKLVASPGSLDAKWTAKKNMLPILSSYQVQAINGVAYYLDKNPGKTICAVSRQDAYGETGTEGVKFAQSKLGFKLGTVETVPATQSDMAAVTVRLRDTKCDAVYVTTGPAQATALLVQGSQNNYTPQWILMSPTFSDKQVTTATSSLYEKYVWMSGDGGEWGDEKIAGMKELITELKANGYGNYVANPDVGNLWGYAQAKVVQAVLEKAVANGDLSRDGILKASNEIGAVDLGGIGAAVDLAKRIPAPKNSIFKADGSKQLAIALLAKDYGSPVAADYRKN